MTTRSRRGRGGKGGHEAPVHVRSREQRAVQLAVQGSTQVEIARELGITQAAVSRILARVELRLYNETVRIRGRHKARVTCRLEYLFREALQAWERSKADTTRRRQRKVVGATGSGGSIAEVIVEDQHGDPRYLEQARKALADTTKLWGLDLPPLNTVPPRAAPDLSKMSTQEFKAHILRRVPQIIRGLDALGATEAELPDAWQADETAATNVPNDDADGQ